MKLKNILGPCLLVTAVALTVSAQAGENETKKPGSSVNPFSHCGIGAAIFENDTAAAISNVIWDLGTTAMTSGISSPQTCNGKDVAAAQFIHETYTNLEEETAQGQGQHITAMLNILGCEATSHSAITNSIRVDFAQDVGAKDYAKKSAVEKSEAYFNTVNSHVNGQFASSCAVI